MAPAPPGALGAMLAGDLAEWSQQEGGSLWLRYPAADLARHGVVVGAAGSGKTETLLKVASLAAVQYGWKVVFIDAKGDPATRDRFVAAMGAAGVGSVRSFPAEAYDGWRGDGRALTNRLMEVSDYSEPYYREMALRVLDLAVSAPGGAPRSSGELLPRLSKPALRAAYRQAGLAAEIEELAPRDVAGVANRYRAFFGAVGGSLDGSWAFEDADACYLLLEGLALKAEAARLGRFFLEDFAHYAAIRKAPTVPVLLVVDEFSALESTADAAHLFERLRSFGAAVVISSQGYAGLGRAADRILDAAQTLIVHRCGDPEKLVARAGTVSRLEHTRYVGSGDAPGGRAGPAGPAASRTGMVSRRDQPRVKANDVRQLPVGEAMVISGGRSARVRVEMVGLDVGAAGAGPGPASPGPTPGDRAAEPPDMPGPEVPPEPTPPPPAPPPDPAPEPPPVQPAEPPSEPAPEPPSEPGRPKEIRFTPSPPTAVPGL